MRRLPLHMRAVPHLGVCLLASLPASPPVNFASRIPANRLRLLPVLAAAPCCLPAGGVLSKEQSRLQMLELVVEALQPQAAEGGSGGSTAGSAGQQPGAELAEATRLVRCAQVLAWLGRQQLAFDRPTGCYSSEQEWRSVAAKRRDGASGAAGGLFLADMAAELAARSSIEALAYPPSSADRLLSTLFLGSGASSSGSGGAGSDREAAALHASLAVLAYYLADGGFMAPTALVAGLQ